MIIEFSVTNFRSFKEKQTLSLLKTKKPELPDNINTQTLQSGQTLDLLNSAVIYGANASGKSNLIKAIVAMFNIIKNSSRLQVNELITQIEPFALSSETKKQPSAFEIDFIDKGVRYVYGFAATREKIISEWLYQYPKGRPQTLIDRDNSDDWGSMSALKGDKKLWQQSTRANGLFLSTAVQLNCQSLKTIFDYLTDKIRFFNTGEFKPITTLNLAEKEKEKILNFLKQGDVGIADFSIKEEVIKDAETINAMKALLQKKASDIKNFKNITISTKHQLESGASIDFDLNDQESDGTEKLFAIAGPWLDVLENGYCLILDELHNSLHAKLLMYLVKMFHHADINKNGAQLIFTSHETTLLDQSFFRRDQIWFCEKQNNATALIPLSEFKVRKGADDLEKAYLSGRYGADFCHFSHFRLWLNVNLKQPKIFAMLTKENPMIECLLFVKAKQSNYIFKH